MRRILALALLGALGWADGSAAAQVSESRVRRAIEDAARGLGQAVAGGSALTGPANTTGGAGHFELAVAATGTAVEIENPARSEGQLDFLLPTATATAALGITRGYDVSTGVTGLGSIDLIGRVGVLAEREDIEDAGRIYGVGARIGIVRENLAVPAVSVTVLRSWTDDLAHGRAGDVTYDGEVRSTSIRADVSKNLLVVTPYAGAGLDRTEIEASYRIPPSRSTGGREITGSIDEAGTHHKVYGGIRVGLLLLDFGLEVGSYDGGAFGSIGARIGL